MRPLADATAARTRKLGWLLLIVVSSTLPAQTERVYQTTEATEAGPRRSATFLTVDAANRSQGGLLDGTPMCLARTYLVTTDFDAAGQVVGLTAQEADPALGTVTVESGPTPGVALSVLIVVADGKVTVHADQAAFETAIAAALGVPSVCTAIAAGRLDITIMGTAASSTFTPARLEVATTFQMPAP